MRTTRQNIVCKIAVIFLCVLLFTSQCAQGAFALRPVSSRYSLTQIDGSFSIDKSSSAGAADIHFGSLPPLPQIPQWVEYAARVLYKDKSFSGHESYYDYSFRVFKNLACLKPDTDSAVTAAALLHRADHVGLEKILKDNKILSQDEKKKIIRFVDEARIIRALPYFKGDKKSRHAIQNYMNMIIQIASEPDVMLLVFAEKITCFTGELNEKQKEYIYYEIIDIYAPLAERLGLTALAGYLRTEALKKYNINIYNYVKGEMESRINMDINDSGTHLKSIENNARDVLKKLKVDARITSRVKSVYSVYEKCNGKGINADDLYDIFGIRVIFSDTRDPWDTLSLPQYMGMSVMTNQNNKYKRLEKSGYAAFHIRAQDESGRFYEFQLISEKNLELYEHGLKSHWSYKIERQSKQAFDVDVIKWTGRFDKDFMSLKNFLNRWVFVLKWDRKDPNNVSCKPLRLPAKSTIADYAALRGVDLFDRNYVNGSIFCVSHDIESCRTKESPRVKRDSKYQLRPADFVYINHVKDWLPNSLHAQISIDKFAKTLRAHMLLNNLYNDNIEGSAKQGLNIVKAAGFAVNNISIGNFFLPLARRLGLLNERELFAAVASTKQLTLDHLKRYARSSGISIVEDKNKIGLDLKNGISEIKLMQVSKNLGFRSLDEFYIAVGSYGISWKTVRKGIDRSESVKVMNFNSCANAA
ncbi:MAG: HD domain-containing protein [Candidatus Omnitrophota bacterium]|jgi:hypothetical protein